MPNPNGRSETATFIGTLFFALSIFLALSLGAASPVRAQPIPTYGPLPCPGHTKSYPADPTICTMTIQIFNDDPNHFVYPVLEMGQGAADQWMQAWFSIKNSVIDKNPYPRNNTYRLYINPTNGLAPNTGISLTLPLYTQLANSIVSNPKICVGCADTFIEWWSGGNIQLYTSPGTSSAVQPPSLLNAMASKSQMVVSNPDLPSCANVQYPTPCTVLPTCVGVKSLVPNSPPPIACETLTIYKDTAGLKQNGGSQLLEYTLAAVNLNIHPPNVDYITYWMDTHNVDFDVSYVNVAWMPAAMGVFGNDQVGYTGTPQTIDQFKGVNGNTGGLTAFQKANTVPNVGGWPQFYDTYPNLDPMKYPPFAYLKFPSLLDIFPSLSAPNPPTDFYPLISAQDWALGPPASLRVWPPIQALFTNWTKWAGSITTAGPPNYYTQTTPASCSGTYLPGTPVTAWCTAIIAERALLLANYTKYRQLFLAGKCNGTPVDINDALLVSHLYGFTPWTEADPGTGCGPKVNLLQDTPGYCVDVVAGACPTVANPNGGKPADRNYSNYQIVKAAYDLLNYDSPMLTGTHQYLFNPYAALIHNPSPDLDIPCAYAYSVDDAQGNIQAEGTGFIVDVGSTANLKPQTPCSPPININLGGDATETPHFFKYAVCQNTPERVKPVIPGFFSFAINATNPAGCPVYIWDNKNGDTNPSGPPLGQMYQFTINADPNNVGASFPIFQNPANATWSPATTAAVGCKGNSVYSSERWCCTQLTPMPPDPPVTGNGIYLFSEPLVSAGRGANIQYNAQAPAAKACTTMADCVAKGQGGYPVCYTTR
jgi:hypothetical protein